MKIKCILPLFMVTSSIFYSQIIPPTQTKVYFDYDEAGNQIYRGDMLFSSSKTTNTQQPTTEIINQDDSVNNSTISEKEFWNGIRIYPVPVKDVLTIDWSEKVDDLITDIGLYEQSTVHWVFQNKKISSLNRKIQINMSQQYMGVYVLTFTLKDGRRLSKNITKF